MNNLIKRLPYIRKLCDQIDKQKSELAKWHTWKPPGHFYSPIPSLDEIASQSQKIFNKASSTIDAVDLNHKRQSDLLKAFAEYYEEMPFPETARDNFRYFFENEYFSYADAVTLYCMLRHIQPKKVIEIGSGFSSALMLDTNDRFLDHRVQFTFVEPHPERLNSLIWETDRSIVQILKQKVQDAPISLFQELQHGDILFIDSSHVSKTGSDVNFLLFEVLPAIASGVHIHFHDIFFPFEYPESWVNEGVAWNEAYILRAFLQYNSSFEINFFVSFVMSKLKDEVRELLPLALKSEKKDISLYDDAPGGSLWLQKVT